MRFRRKKPKTEVHPGVFLTTDEGFLRILAETFMDINGLVYEWSACGYIPVRQYQDEQTT